MKIRIGSLILALAMTTALSACGGGGGGSSSGGDSGGLSSVAGLWDWTESDSGAEDVYYIEIFADGEMIAWDYQGDEFNNGENCYKKSDEYIESLGGNLYDFGGLDVTLTVNNNVMSYTEQQSRWNSTMVRVSGFTSAEFNEC